MLKNVVKKDIDNFVKFVFDSLNKHLYVDDSQIFELKWENIIHEIIPIFVVNLRKLQIKLNIL